MRTAWFLADFVTSTSDVQLFPKRIKSQVNLTGKTAQDAARQPPAQGTCGRKQWFENKYVQKEKAQVCLEKQNCCGPPGHTCHARLSTARYMKCKQTCKSSKKCAGIKEKTVACFNEERQAKRKKFMACARVCFYPFLFLAQFRPSFGCFPV